MIAHDAPDFPQGLSPRSWIESALTALLDARPGSGAQLIGHRILGVHGRFLRQPDAKYAIL
jgi:hypothetical protein